MFSYLSIIMLTFHENTPLLINGIFPTKESEIEEPIYVLIIEDDAVIAAITKKRLEENHNIRAEIETDTNKVLDKIQSRGVDCVISDFDMPEKDGLEVLKDVRQHYPNLPFILFTGKGSEAIAEAAFAAGATSYVRKDSNGNEFSVLEQRVKDTVRHSRNTKWRRKSLRRQYLAIVLAIISIVLGGASILISMYI
jgi:DNA-binding NtrC family response regulator